MYNVAVAAPAQLKVLPSRNFVSVEHGLMYLYPKLQSNIIASLLSKMNGSCDYKSSTDCWIVPQLEVI